MRRVRAWIRTDTRRTSCRYLGSGSWIGRRSGSAERAANLLHQRLLGGIGAVGIHEIPGGGDQGLAQLRTQGVFRGGEQLVDSRGGNRAVVQRKLRVDGVRDLAEESGEILLARIPEDRYGLDLVEEKVALFEAAGIVRADHDRQNREEGFGVLFEFQRHLESRIGESASALRARNLRDLGGSRNGPSEDQGCLEDLDGLADDPHAIQLAVGEFELDVDPAGAMQVMALRAGEARGGAGMRQQALLRKVRT